MSGPETQKKSSGAIGGGVWTAVERVVSQAGQLIVFVAAARILTPSEFGVFALVSACAILLMRAAEGGWGAYIMAWSGDRQVPAQVLGVAVMSGFAAGMLGGLAAFALPSFGVSISTAWLVALFAIWLIGAVTSSALKGILIWQRRLKTSAALEISGELVGIVAALWGLTSGLGVFALILGRLAYQSVHLTGATILTRVIPRFGLRGDPLRDLLNVSGQLFAVRMIYNLRVYAATFVIGFFLGPAAVGFYRAAERLVGALAEVVGVPAQTLGWSLFREARDRAGGTTDRFQDEAGIFFPALLGLTVPVFLWVAIMGRDIVTGVLGPEWLPAVQVVALLAAARAIMMPGSVTEPILTVAGEIKRLPPISIFYLIMTVGLVAISAPFGLVPLAWAQVAVAIVIAVTTMRLLHQHAAIDWRGFMPRLLRLMIPTAAGAVVLLLLRDGALMREWSPLLRAVAVVPPACIAYALVALIVEPDLRRAVLAMRHRGKVQDEGSSK